MAPTEYRVIAKRATLTPLPQLRGMVAAGEALNPEVLRAWREATGLEIRDGYGQTETGQLTGAPPGVPARAGSMGKPLPGIGLLVEDGELTVDPRTRADLLPRLSRRAGRAAQRGRRVGDTTTAASGERLAHGRPGRPQDEDGWLHFQGRDDDVIISAGYRIGPFEVESALVAHPAVAEAAAVAAPDEERGSVVRAVVVLRDGYAPCAGARLASCRSTSSARRRLTSTRASSTSRRSFRRPRAARSSARCCAQRISSRRPDVNVGRPPPRGRAAGGMAAPAGAPRRAAAQTSCSAA